MPSLYVEVRPGEGGDDAFAFAEELIDSLHRFTLKRGWSGSISPGNRTLVLQLTLSTKQIGEARKALGDFAGVHRVQRTPSSDGGRRHTSTATVAVLQDLIAATVQLRDEDLRVDRMRGSGTGGQRRNKVETAVRLTHLPTGIVITRTSGRSQAANLDDARRQLLEDLSSRAHDVAQRSQQNRRNAQTTVSDGAKDFTHCIYRDEIVRHRDGRRWSVRAWRQGRLS